MSNLIGNIESNITLNGTINPVLSLNGKVNNNLSLKGEISNREALKGKISSGLSVLGTIISNNTLNGSITIGGSASLPDYSGSYEITPKVDSQTMATQNKIMRRNVNIKGIPYFETSNLYGNTVYIGSEVQIDEY